MRQVISKPPKIVIKKFDMDIKTLKVNVELEAVEPIELKGLRRLSIFNMHS